MERVKTALVGFCVFLFLVGGTGRAKSIPGMPNELLNPSFEDGLDGDADNWDGTGTLPERLGLALGLGKGFVSIKPYDGNWAAGIPWMWFSSASKTIYQVIDESNFPGWNPGLNQKEVDISAYTSFYLIKNEKPVRGFVGLELAYWPTNEGPAPAWDDPGWILWDPYGTGFVAWVEKITESYIQPSWEEIGYYGILPVHPRWVRVGVTSELDAPSGYGEIGVDSLDIETRSISAPPVPELGSLLLLSTGLLVYIIKKRIA